MIIFWKRTDNKVEQIATLSPTNKWTGDPLAQMIAQQVPEFDLQNPSTYSALLLHLSGSRLWTTASSETKVMADKAGSFVTIDDRVVFIGGAGAGGGSGGAAATDRSLLARMPTFWERDVVGRSEHQLAAVDDADARDLYMAMENVLKTVNLDLSDEYLILTSERVVGDLFGQAGMRGAFGESKGKRFIAVSTGAIDAAIQRDGLPRVLQWEGLPTTATRADLLQHVMAHELGHRWYKKNPVAAEQWEQARMSAVSGYAIYCGFKSENFAEAFGLFTQGYDLPADVDGFFLENVR